MKGKSRTAFSLIIEHHIMKHIRSCTIEEAKREFREDREQSKERTNMKELWPKSTTDAYQCERCQIGYCKENKTNRLPLNVNNMFAENVHRPLYIKMQ